MNESLLQILLKAKELNKWVSTEHLIKYKIREVSLMELEDEGLILVAKGPGCSPLVKLTLKGYHYFSK
ncbi:hypothetical protein QR721_13555 [Aciduricibacillus chroicocephali]|uniref:Uncharacterized protein n=1 Tax=Aciduricibacillus chroicocephali TaxID=3054939 RepID=A0ABY9KWF8_9BACI|nr:hypothetical protein QR721_13555 [Bacillaceae bacterium 44XB]